MRLGAVLLGTALAAGCAGLPERFPAAYVDDGRVYRTTVDSAAARYVVEHGESIARAVTTPGGEQTATGRNRDPGWDTFITGLLEDPSLVADPARLASIARLVSTDFATAVYRMQLDARPENRAFRQRVERIGSVLARAHAGQAVAAGGASLPAPAWMGAALQGDAALPAIPRVRLVLVPGWRWRSTPENGADLERARPVAATFGLACDRIETDEDGTVEENARVVEHWLADAPGQEPIVLVSASKGGAETALALDAMKGTPAADRVIAWINVSGLVGGSPIADGSLVWPARLFVGGMLALAGGSMRPVESMSLARSRARREDLALPPHIVVVNYAAAPYSGDVTPRGAFTYSFLRPSGPNDGISLLADARWPGLTLIEPGVDHFLDGPRVDARLTALLVATLSVVADRARVVTSGAADPSSRTAHAEQVTTRP